MAWFAIVPAFGVFFYVLGNRNVIDTPTAISLVAGLLLLSLLYFPLRYRTRLTDGPRGLSLAFALLWLIILGTPISQRVYPEPRIGTFTLTPNDLPFALPATVLGKDLDLEVIGHLLSGTAQATRGARWKIVIDNTPAPPIRLAGTFRQVWGDPTDVTKTSPILRFSRTSFATRLPALRNGSHIKTLQITGQAKPELTLVVRPNGQRPLWLQCLLGGILLCGAAIFDRSSGAGKTASSLTIVTGAALTGSIIFATLGDGVATFRELFGAIVAGALLGGPIGGVAAWILGAQRDKAR